MAARRRVLAAVCAASFGFVLGVGGWPRLGSSVASACSCGPVPEPSTARGAAQVVFVAKVVGVTGGPGLPAITLAVERVYKGALPATLVAQSVSTCGIELQMQVGERWLVYARTEPLIILSCSRTAKADAAKADIEAMGPGMPPSPSGTTTTTTPSATPTPSSAPSDHQTLAAGPRTGGCLGCTTGSAPDGPAGIALASLVGGWTARRVARRRR